MSAMNVLWKKCVAKQLFIGFSEGWRLPESVVQMATPGPNKSPAA